MSQLRSSPDLAVPVPRTAGDLVVEGARAPSYVRSTLTRRRRLRSWLLPVEMVTALLAGFGAAVVVEAPDRFAVVVVVLSMLTNYHMGLETIRPGLPHLGRILRDAALPILAVTIGVATGVLATPRLSDALAIVAAVALAAIAATLVRRLLEGQVRMVVVGDTDTAGRAAARWAGDKRAKVVGAVLVDGTRSDALALSDTFGVDVALSADNVAEWVERWQVDLVAVSGPSMSADGIRQLCWALEGTPASLAVMGLIDSVAPHRIDAASLAGGTLLHVRSSRPSAFVRGVKAAADRILGVLLLVIAAPLLAVLSLLIRLDTPGPAFFRQVRVGQNGVPFTMYKLRTMHRDAEDRRAALLAMNEGNGLLFKIHNDPRITRLGGVLRKTSLDELPQLVNVVLGEMSLVGPRPALPQEVAEYDEYERRRLAVRPGMTGLWQVSGRSNLSREESVELDLQYTDNWRLVGDLGIGIRTVDAVARSRGAY